MDMDKENITEKGQDNFCSLCKKIFSNRYNFTKHLKVVHNVEAVEKNCPKCEKKFSTKYKLDKHLRTANHANGDQQMDSIEKSTSQSQEKYQCYKCEKEFIEKKKLRRHVNSQHCQKNCRLICPIDKCCKKFTVHSELRMHISIDHGIPQDEKLVHFDTYDDFKRWKINVEKEEHSSYIVTRSLIKSDRKRRLKSSGTVKIGAACTSAIILRQRDNSFSARYFPTHVGHTCSIGKLFLQSDDRIAIAGKLQMGIPDKKILHDVRHSNIEAGQFSRIHLIEKKDLHNIRKSFNINHPMKYHENDWISVKLWVQQMAKKPTNPVLFFKQQGEEFPTELFNNNDFCLIMMTNYQSEQLIRFGCDRLCVDGTHGLNKYDFQMYTVLVVNELNHGVPVAFCFSNRSDTQLYSHFFSCIRSRAGTVTPRVFMSDDEPAFYNAWSAIMGPVETQLLCAWHVLRNWRNNLCKIKTPEKKKLVYKVLLTLLRETDETKFGFGLTQTLAEFQADFDTVDFGTYFARTYANRVEKWAYCYRKHVGINVNMHLEAFHKTLKYCYLDGKKCKRLDRSIYEVLCLVHDKKFEAIISKEKNRKPDAVLRIHESHNRSKNITRNMITEDGYNRWLVCSSHDKNVKYIIEKIQNCPLDNCLMRCDLCNICYHTFKCSCENNFIYFNICKHIHACVREFLSPLACKDVVQAEVPALKVDEFEICSPTKNDEIVEQYQQKFSLLIQLSESASHFSDEKNRRLMKEVDKLISDFQQNTTSNFIIKDTNSTRNITPQARYFSTKASKRKHVTSISKMEQQIISESFQTESSSEVINIHSDFDHTYCIFK